MIKEIITEYGAAPPESMGIMPRIPLNQYPMGAVPGIGDQLDDHFKRNWWKYLLGAGLIARPGLKARSNYNKYNDKANALQNQIDKLSGITDINQLKALHGNNFGSDDELKAKHQQVIQNLQTQKANYDNQAAYHLGKYQKTMLSKVPGLGIDNPDTLSGVDPTTGLNVTAYNQLVQDQAKQKQQAEQDAYDQAKPGLHARYQKELEANGNDPGKALSAMLNDPTLNREHVAALAKEKEENAQIAANHASTMSPTQPESQDPNNPLNPTTPTEQPQTIKSLLDPYRGSYVGFRDRMTGSPVSLIDSITGKFLGKDKQSAEYKSKMADMAALGIQTHMFKDADDANKYFNRFKSFDNLHNAFTKKHSDHLGMVEAYHNAKKTKIDDSTNLLSSDNVSAAQDWQSQQNQKKKQQKSDTKTESDTNINDLVELSLTNEDSDEFGSDVRSGFADDRESILKKHGWKLLAGLGAAGIAASKHHLTANAHEENAKNYQKLGDMRSAHKEMADAHVMRATDVIHKGKNMYKSLIDRFDKKENKKIDQKK